MKTAVAFAITSVILAVAWMAYELRKVRRDVATRLDALDLAVMEGLDEAERHEAQPVNQRAILVRAAVEYCSQQDVVVFTFEPSKGFAIRTKVGQC